MVELIEEEKRNRFFESLVSSVPHPSDSSLQSSSFEAPTGWNISFGNSLLKLQKSEGKKREQVSAQEV